MKRRFLVLAVLCMICVAAVAQRRSSTTNKGKATRGKGTAAVKPPVTAPDTTKPAVDNTKVTSSAPGAGQKAPADKKPIMVNGKPFVPPRDGYYTKNNIINAKVVPLPVLREADVVFEHRIWRDIDVRDRFNEYMASPKGRLIDVIMNAVAAGELTAYDPVQTLDDPGGDKFTVPLTPDGAKRKMVDSAVINIIDPKTGEKTGSKMVAGEFNPDSVLRFRIKEDYIFDKQRSVTEYRIIGIAPLVKPKIGDAVAADYQPAFWIYFPDARKVLATKPVVNKHNDAIGLSYDDMFMKRMFASYITKESNDKDERIKDYAQGLDRLYESDRIKKTLLDWELNLWQY